jgi:hypothetical protein
MALIVITDNHDALLRKIEYAIDAEVVEDWSYAARGDFVFTGDLAKGMRLRPTIDGDAVVFGVVPAPGSVLTPMTYARAHASFAEVLLEHRPTFGQVLRLFFSRCGLRQQQVGFAVEIVDAVRPSFRCEFGA